MSEYYSDAILFECTQFRDQIKDLIQKNATALGAQKKLEADLTEVYTLTAPYISFLIQIDIIV